MPFGGIAFGLASSSETIDRWIQTWKNSIYKINLVLVIAGSRTSEVEGISAAGSTAESRRYTAVADAELFLKGPSAYRSWPLPSLPAGVSPALISYAASRFVPLNSIVLAVGVDQSPPFPHLLIESPFIGPSACLSTGKSMSYERVNCLWEKGYSMGLRVTRPLLIAECVPGGTTTALAIFKGLGLAVESFISGSARNPPIALKKKIVDKGLREAQLGLNPSPKILLSALGDPFQAVAAGLLLGARRAGIPVLLGGGSQMLAVLSLALSAVSPDLRSKFVEDISISTTSWLVEETNGPFQQQSSFVTLLSMVEQFFGVSLLGLATGLRFHSSSCQVLKDYELGYVKEGVGAGALALLAQLHGASCQELVTACESAVGQLHSR